MRGDPRVRALCQRARRPTIQLIISSVLLGPGIVAARPPMTSVPTADRPLHVPSDHGYGPVEAAWRQRILERQRVRLIAALATEYRIPYSLADLIQRTAVEEQVDPRLAFGLVQTESNFKSRAVSDVGAVGLTQVMPATARWFVPGTKRRDLFEPSTNLHIGLRYLGYLLTLYDGNTRLALTAYNRGPGTVDQLLRHGQTPWNGYARRVLHRLPAPVDRSVFQFTSTWRAARGTPTDAAPAVLLDPAPQS